MIGWKRKWCTVNREFCEDGEVVRWRAIGHRERRCKGRIGRGDHKVNLKPLTPKAISNGVNQQILYDFLLHIVCPSRTDTNISSPV